MTKKTVYFEVKKRFNYLTGMHDRNWETNKSSLDIDIKRVKKIPTKRCG